MQLDDSDIEYGDATYVYSLFAPDEFDNIDGLDGANPLPPAECDWKACPDCSVRMQPMTTSYRCTICGRDEQVFDQSTEYNSSVIDNYNTNDTFSTSLRIVGKDSHRYHKALLNTTSDYSKIQNNTTNKQLSRFNSQSTDGKLPLIIMREAADLYSQLQRHKIVCRGDGRKGTLGGCIYFVCREHNIAKKPKEITTFLGIDESYLSKGDKLLRKLHAKGKIDILIYYDPEEAYLSQYFQLLGIDVTYKPFVTALNKRSSQVDMAGVNNSRTSTKCAGSIYMLKMQLSLPFGKSDIVKYCKISKSTYMRYYDFLVKNRRLLAPLFREYGIPRLRGAKKKASVSESSTCSVTN